MFVWETHLSTVKQMKVAGYNNGYCKALLDCCLSQWPWSTQDRTAIISRPQSCKFPVRILASRWNKEMFRCYEEKIEESEKAGSRQDSNPGHLACAVHIEDREGLWLSGCAVMKVPFFVFFFLSCYDHNVNITVAN